MTTVTYTATDAGGLTTDCSFTVTVGDTVAPTITCPSNVNTIDCSTVAVWDEPTAADNCGIDSTNSSHNSGESFAIGTTTVTYTVWDAAGSSASCNFDVIITSLPSADAGPDITICNGLSDTIGGSPAGSGGAGLGYNYYWFNLAGTPATLDDDNIANPVASPNVTTNYILIVEDATTGCAGTDLITVTVTDYPTAGISVADHVKVSVDSTPATGTIFSPLLAKKDNFFASHTV